jgi:hypothetical protein
MYLFLCILVATGRSCDLHGKREIPAEFLCEPLLWRTKGRWILGETLLGWGVNGIGSMSFPAKSLGFSGDVTIQLEMEWDCWLSGLRTSFSLPNSAEEQTCKSWLWPKRWGQWGRSRTPVWKSKHTPGLNTGQLCGMYWSSILQL